MITWDSVESRASQAQVFLQPVIALDESPPAAVWKSTWSAID